MSGLRALEPTCRCDAFFSSSNSAGNAASLKRNVSIWIWPSAEVQRLPVRETPARGTSFSGRPSRAPVPVSSINRQPTASAGKFTAAGIAFHGENAGILALIASLERFAPLRVGGHSPDLLSDEIGLAALARTSGCRSFQRGRVLAPALPRGALRT